MIKSVNEQGTLNSGTTWFRLGNFYSFDHPVVSHTFRTTAGSLDEAVKSALSWFNSLGGKFKL